MNRVLGFVHREINPPTGEAIPAARATDRMM
jgi:hypothetical protein